MIQVSFDQFHTLTGILSLKQARKLVSPKLLKQLKDLISIDDDGMICWEACHSSLEVLRKIIQENPTLYIGTQVDDDNGDLMYENSCRFVNRNVYFLCSKNQDKELWATTD